MISYNTNLVNGVMKALEDNGYFEFSIPEIIALVEEKLKSPNTTKAIIALLKWWDNIESAADEFEGIADLKEETRVLLEKIAQQ